MTQMHLQIGCEQFGNNGHGSNISASNPALAHILRGCMFTNESVVPVYVDIVDPNAKLAAQNTGSGAVMYIIVVLVFYSAGIIVMIIKYLRREKRELEEERILEDFFRSMPAYKKEREQNHVNRVAIHAFHALTSFSYDDGDDAFTSDDEASQKRNDTIHETEVEHIHHDIPTPVPLNLRDDACSVDKHTQTSLTPTEQTDGQQAIRQETHL